MADPAITLKLDDSDLQRAAKELARFGSRSLPQVAARAINKTLTGVRTDAVREIQKEITPKATIIRRHMSIFRANKNHLSGEVKSEGRPLGLIHYKARQTAKGVTVHVKKKKGRKLLRAAYIKRSMARTGGRSGAWVEGGKSVFRRDFWGEDYFGPQKSKRKNIPYARLPKKYRLPISRLAGPRVPDIMGNRPVMAALDKKALVRFKKNFDHELEYKLSKLRGK